MWEVERYARVVNVSAETLQSMEPERVLSLVESAIDRDRFSPDTIESSLSCSLYNPGLYVYEDHLSMGEEGWGPVGETTPIGPTQKYIPTEQAIRYLASTGPYVEVGAGNGYLSHVINVNGGDSIATDKFPKSRVEESYSRLWEDIEKMEAKEVEKEYPDRDIILCHPEALEWTEQFLDILSSGTVLVYIGSWAPSNNATPLFHQKLSCGWNLLEKLPVYNWKTTDACAYAFKKL